MLFDLPTPSVPIIGGGQFPVRRIFCVGRNYRAHAIEMGGDPDREAPFFFTKPADAVVPDGAQIPYPAKTADYQHEAELVIAIGKAGRDVAVGDALDLVFGYAAGLDMTRRDLQTVARKAGRPWDMAKGFDQSAPCGAITPAAEAGPIEEAQLWLQVNGAQRQASPLSLMIWSVPEIIAELSSFVALKPGDLIYTGTPDGVEAVGPGDTLTVHIDGLTDLSVTIAA